MSADPDSARRLQEALQLARQTGDHGTLSSTLNNLAALEHHQAYFARSEELFLRRWNSHSTKSIYSRQPHRNSTLGRSISAGLLDRARAFYAQALATFEQNQDQSYTAIIENCWASSNWTKGKLARP